MLEKEQKITKKRMLTLMLTFALCIGACMTVFAYRIERTGEISGMSYTIIGEHSDNVLSGITEANIFNNKYSYVRVRFYYNGVVVGSAEKSNVGGTQRVTLKRTIGSNRNNWRVYNTAKRTYPSGTSAVVAGGYTIY